MTDKQEETLRMTANQVSEACRVKYWRELSIEEKIERLREQVKNVQHTSGSTAHEVQKLSHELHNHDHVNGRLMVAANRNEPWGYQGALYGGAVLTPHIDEDYF